MSKVYNKYRIPRIITLSLLIIGGLCAILAVYINQEQSRSKLAEVTVDPAEIKKHLDEGDRFYAEKKYGQALKSYTKALNLDSHLPETYYKLGKTYQALQNWESAITQYSNAVQIKVDYAEAFLQRGICYIKKGEPASGIEDIEQALSLNPKESLAYAARGEAKIKLRDYSGALSDAKKSLELDSQNIQALLLLGHAKLALGDESGFQDLIKVEAASEDIEIKESIKNLQQIFGKNTSQDEDR